MWLTSLDTKVVELKCTVGMYEMNTPIGIKQKLINFIYYYKTGFDQVTHQTSDKEYVQHHGNMKIIYEQLV